MRQPPRSAEAESGLIGSVLIDDEAMGYAIGVNPFVNIAFYNFLKLAIENINTMYC